MALHGTVIAGNSGQNSTAYCYDDSDPTNGSQSDKNLVVPPGTTQLNPGEVISVTQNPPDGDNPPTYTYTGRAARGTGEYLALSQTTAQITVTNPGNTAFPMGVNEENPFTPLANGACSFARVKEGFGYIVAG